MGCNAISEELNVRILLYVLGHSSPLDSTVAVFQTKNMKQLLWQNDASHLITEWKVVCHEFHSNVSKKSRPIKIAGSTSKLSSDVTASNVCSVCGKLDTHCTKFFF